MNIANRRASFHLVVSPRLCQGKDNHEWGVRREEGGKGTAAAGEGGGAPILLITISSF
jgi:hypothetical protein